MNKIRLLLLIFLIMSLSFIVTGCSLLPKTSLAIIEYHLEKSADEDGTLTAQIIGTARNDGSAKLEYAEVKGKFYREDGTLLYSGVDNTNDLDPAGLDIGKIWEFTIPYSSAVHPSLNILSCNLKKDSSGARMIGEAENNGDVMLSFAKITGTFCSRSWTELGSGTATTTRLGVGEIWEYTIFYPKSNYEKVNNVKAEVTETEYEPEPTKGVVVDHATAQVGKLIGRTVMP